MKYLKTYESLRDDFKSDLEIIKNSYNQQLDKIQKEIKDEVDNFMFDITDEYQTSEESYINIFEINKYFEIGYENIEFNLTKSNDFLKLMENVSLRIKEQLGLDFTFSGHADYSDSNDNDPYGEFFFLSKNIVDIKQLREDISELSNGVESWELSNYTIKLNIFIR